MNIDIVYDRSEKEYQWITPDGEIVSAPAKSKAELFRQAVAILDPQLDAAVREIIEVDPQLERVVWRGAELVITGGVEVQTPPQGDVVALVASGDEYGRYALEASEHGLTCQCVHFADGYAPLAQTGNRVCKHIAAYWLRITSARR
jgi:uncharacterized Zn finger protein